MRISLHSQYRNLNETIKITSLRILTLSYGLNNFRCKQAHAKIICRKFFSCPFTFLVHQSMRKRIILELKDQNI